MKNIEKDIIYCLGYKETLTHTRRSLGKHTHTLFFLSIHFQLFEFSKARACAIQRESLTLFSLLLIGQRAQICVDNVRIREAA